MASGPARLRLVGRRVGAELLVRALERTDTTEEQLASALGTSQQEISRRAAGIAHNFPVGDVVALHLGGRQAVALVYARELVTWLEARAMKLGLRREQHQARLARKFLDIAGAERTGEYRAALSDLARMAEEALRDADVPDPDTR